MTHGRWVIEHIEICTKTGVDEIIDEIAPNMLCVMQKPNGELFGYDKTWRFHMSRPDAYGKRIVTTFRRYSPETHHESGMSYAFYYAN